MYIGKDLIQPEKFNMSKGCSLFLRQAFLLFTTKQSTIAPVRCSFE